MTTTNRHSGSGLNSSSGGELKRYLGCTGSTPTSAESPQAGTPLGRQPPPRADTRPPGQTPAPWQTLPLGRHPLGRHLPARRHNPPPPDGHCSGRYESYWNVFLFLKAVQKKYLQISEVVTTNSFIIICSLHLQIHMSHFAYACKMRYPLNLVLENIEYL